MCRGTVAIILLFACKAAALDCGSSLTWSTGNGNILLNGQPFVLKGVNFFGFETDTFAPHGLWSYSLDGFLDFIKNNNFNAVRLPFSMEMVMNNPAHPNVNCGANPTICNLNALDLMGAFIDRCAARGILVMLDNHVPSPDIGITELWYDSSTYTEANVLTFWDTILNRFGSKWNVFAIDLKNEPHGASTWGYLNTATDWNLAAQRFITYFGANHPDYKGLFFVEGVQESASTPNTNQQTHFWGENLEGVYWHPVTTGNAALDARIVYSPHVYGPDVYNQAYFQVSNFPSNMPAIWNAHFGYVESLTGHPIATGEWGGHYTAGSADETWHNALADWMRTNCMTDQFYWCLNPNSGDTGGLLNDDWTTPNTRKLTLLANVVPYPTNFTYATGQICITHGSFANSACNPNTTSSSSTASTASSSSTASSGSSSTSSGTTSSASSTASSTPSSTTSTSASTASSSATSSGQDCGSTLTWSTGNGNILLNGHPFVLKGVNYFGFETDTYAPHGLWSYSLDGILDFVKANNFNAIRVPFSLDMIRSNPAHPNVNCGANPTICNLNALDLMAAFIDRCAARGILVMLDNQVPWAGSGIPELWYDTSEFTEANVLAIWDTALTRFGSKWNLFAIDLKNEPHGAATWGYENTATDWNLAAQRFISHLSASHPDYKGLFFVEGVDVHASSPNTNPPGSFWGENLAGVTWHPLTTGDAALDARIVYSPHVYGPDVYNMDYFQVSNFPANMPANWNMQFGFVESLTGHPIAIGEWGGHYYAGSNDETWANAFADWMRTNCMTDSFYWCLNPNGGDTGGLLNDDWTTPNTRKLNLIASVVPYPTNFTTTNGQICITHGWFANAACNSNTTSSSSTASTSSSSSASSTTPSTSSSSSTTPSTTSSASSSPTTTTSSTTSSTTTQGGGGGSGQVTYSVSQVGSWTENGLPVIQVAIALTNNGASNICDMTIQMNPSGTTITNSWNMVWIGNGRWNFASWMDLGAGQTNSNSIGMNIQSTTLPTFSTVSIQTC